LHGLGRANRSALAQLKRLGGGTCRVGVPITVRLARRDAHAIGFGVICATRGG